jgi:hypothetical protein
MIHSQLKFPIFKSNLELDTYSLSLSPVQQSIGHPNKENPIQNIARNLDLMYTYFTTSLAFKNPLETKKWIFFPIVVISS